MFIQLSSRACALLLFVPLSLAQDADSDSSVPGGLEPGDWHSIEAAREAAQYRAYPNGEILHAQNTRQGWLMSFDGEGFRVKPNDQNWVWGLSLDSYGFEQATQEIHGQAIASIDRDTVRYDWNSNVQEWYVNGAFGLEHGYTIQERPTSGIEPDSALVFDLSVRGTLHPEIMDHGKGIRFLDDQGTTVVTYTGLHVFDANGITQPASFIDCGAGFRISIDESKAVYPLIVDPIAEQAYLKASNTLGAQSFGTSIAVSGDLVAVGAPGERSNATGVNGDQTNLDAASSGAVYIFERIGGSWSQQAYLKASNTNAGDFFGQSVALSGNMLAVGARDEDSNAAGVNGNEADNSLVNSGAVYVFERTTGVWAQQAYLKAANPDSGDGFGSSISVAGDVIVVGAASESSNATGINGNQGDNSSTDSGAAYVFRKMGGTWIQESYLKASNSEADDRFGTSLSISNNRIAISAPGEDSDAIGSNGDQSNNSQSQSGAIYVFEYSNGSWNQQAYLKAAVSHPDLVLGYDVSLSDDLLIAGSYIHAHLFEWSISGWSQSTQLTAVSPYIPTNNAVSTVAVHGQRILLGNIWEGDNNTGINDPSGGSTVIVSGGAYLYERIQGTWTLLAHIKSNQPSNFDIYAFGAALSNDIAVLSAPGDESNAVGVNGNQFDNSISNAGAVHVYDLNASHTNFCGKAVPNSSGQPGRMSMSGSFLVSNNAFTLHATDLPTGQFGYFLNSVGQGYVANPGGSQGDLCLGGGAAMGRHNRAGEVGFSGASGQISLTLDLNDMPAPGGSAAVMAGEQWNFQCWFRDQNPGSTSNFTDGLWVQFE